jgi:hypothetical protein
MDRYLKEFMGRKLGKWRGSLVKVNFIGHRNAKEYMNRLAGEGKIERAAWGWYYVPGKAADVLDFLRNDRNFKVLVAQTAASFWNGDFVHRNVYSIAVEDGSYKKAMEAFAAKRGWNFMIQVNRNARRDIGFTRKNGLNVEKPAESAAECMRNWAFTDAFSVILSSRAARAGIKEFYWKRVSGTNVRVGQAVNYGLKHGGNAKMPEIMKEEIEESMERVMELA